MKITLYPKYLIRSLFVNGKHDFYKAGYKLLYPEYGRHGMTPWQHYVIDGRRKGYDNGSHPSGTVFFREGYELEYPDVKQSDYDPWHHYADNGMKEGRDNGLHPDADLFFPEGYLAMYPDVAGSGADPWHHYAIQGHKEGRDNGLHPKAGKFFADGYLAMYPDAADSGMDPWHHYVLCGKAEGRDNGLHPDAGIFFAEGYLAMYPDVADTGMDPWHHYILCGKKEGRDNGLHPDTAMFSAKEYLQEHPELAESGTDPWHHYALSIKRKCRYSVDSMPETGSMSVSWLVPENGYSKDGSDGRVRHFKRCAVFSASSAVCKVTKMAIDYLRSLNDSADFIVAVYDDPLGKEEIDSLKGLAQAVCCVAHDAGVFGSYKYGIDFLDENGLLDSSDELVLCSDSAIVSQGFFKKYFADTREIAGKHDFYGWSSVNVQKPQLQSGLMCFSRKVFSSSCFREFFNSVTAGFNVSTMTLQYEEDLTEALTAEGFSFSALLKSEDFPETFKYGIAEDIAHFPISVFERLGYMLLKSEVLDQLGCNNDGIFNLLSFLEKRDIDFFRKIIGFCPKLATAYEEYKGRKIAFSFVVPTYNRAGMITGSIDSVLQQNYDNYEIIVSDDASTDNTVEMLREKYADFISRGVIKIVLNDGKGKGVCHARNLGLSAATKEYIAYLDSDNRILPNFLDNFTDAILLEPERKTFYGKSYRMQKGGWKSLEKEFDLTRLKKSNFIDLGVFVHSRELLKLGGFDESLRRLVDWDLIVRYTSVYEPMWVSNVIMEYNNVDDYPRITNSVEHKPAYDAVRKKIDDCSVTTIILSYNHELYISQTIESALMQDYDKGHRILISDDGSSDRTRDIIRYYAEKYSDVITDISNDVNKGFSGNLKYCLEHVSSKYVEILEGDDYYLSPDKIKTQAEMLSTHPGYMMVFSKLKLFNTKTLKFSYLARQEKLRYSAGIEDFLNEPTLNLIANFTSCMFRTDLLRILPEQAFHPRLTEMAVAFTALKFSRIGFINVPLNVYRVHEGSLWSGKSKLDQLKEGCEVRRTLRAISGIQRLDPIIEKYERQIEELKAKNA
jgi:glycosyltransferase involved in cell wall biosynthesis